MKVPKFFHEFVISKLSSTAKTLLFNNSFYPFPKTNTMMKHEVPLPYSFLGNEDRWKTMTSDIIKIAQVIKFLIDSFMSFKILALELPPQHHTRSA